VPHPLQTIRMDSQRGIQELMWMIERPCLHSIIRIDGDFESQSSIAGKEINYPGCHH
jgi:hypothetical protein